MELLAQAGEVTGQATGEANVAEVVFFAIFGVIAVGAGIAMISMRNVVHGALMLVINFAAIAGMFVLLQTGFLSVVQIIVYAGAIMVLFLFVIMLLAVDRDDLLPLGRWWHRAGAIVLALLTAGGLLFAFVGPYTGEGSRCGDQAPVAAQPDPEEVPDPDRIRAERTSDVVACAGLDAALAEEANGSVSFVGSRLFGRFTFVFELAALLLTVATIGAIVVGRRKDVDESDAALLAEPTRVAGGPGPEAS